MKLKIVEPGWETYNGYLGSVEVVNGESVDHASVREARRIAGSLQVHDIETGKSASISQALLDHYGDADEYQILPTQAQVEEAAAAAAAAAALEGGEKTEKKPEGDSETVVTPEHTQESLAALPDSEGIKGLREIGQKFDVTSSSIAGLIEKILEAQAKANIKAD